jgi:hypothetical protein
MPVALVDMKVQNLAANLHRDLGGEIYEVKGNLGRDFHIELRVDEYLEQDLRARIMQAYTEMGWQANPASNGSWRFQNQTTAGEQRGPVDITYLFDREKLKLVVEGKELE